MNFLYKKSFLKIFDLYDSNYQKLIVYTENEIRKYYTSQKIPYGLGIKKLYDNGIEKVYEARVSDKIRIVWIKSKDLVVFTLLGNHDEVRRYIKKF